VDEKITKKARELVRWGETRDPFRLAQMSGVEVVFRDLGGLKGMYNVIKNVRFIVVNNTLKDGLMRIVCAHELGHDQFHRKLAKDKSMLEFAICNMNQPTEYDANLFASEILLKDDEVIELASSGYDIDQIARSLGSDVNLVALKLDTLSRQGHPFKRFYSKSNFLK
jgi:Zn-dependent peptidase ImmA (M78 family)